MNRFSKAVFFGNNQEFQVATKDEQEKIILCVFTQQPHLTPILHQ